MDLTVADADATALGAAMLAGVGAGAFADIEAAVALLPPGRVVAPRMPQEQRLRERERWREFVSRAASLYKTSGGLVPSHR